MLICSACQELLYEPVTISCGHTFCRGCLEKEWDKAGGDPACRNCGTVHHGIQAARLGTNVVVSNLLKKWLPGRSKAAELKEEGNKCSEKRDFQRAITLYSEAISIYDADHLLFSNRSHAYASLQQYDKALEDAEKVVAMRPDWHKGFVMKGNALYELGHYEEAAVAFLKCLALNPDITLAKENLSKSLCLILSGNQMAAAGEEDTQNNGRWQPEYNLSKFYALVNSSGMDLAALRPHLEAGAWSQLKTVIEEKMEKEEDGRIDGSFTAPSVPSPPAIVSLLGAVMDCRIKSTELEIASAESYDDVKKNHQQFLEVTHSQLENQHQQHSRPQSMEEERCRSIDHHPSSPEQPILAVTTSGSCQKSLKTEMEAAVMADLQKVDQSLLNVEDVECSLCYRLFYEPVTTPCGHTFCRQCLDRNLDHHINCPMCRRSLAKYLAERRSVVAECLQTILETCFPKEHRKRQQIHQDEMSELARMGLDDQHDVPIFVCMLGFPSVLYPLHVFEPRYRLMIRQCLESGTRQFGMCACMEETEEEFTEYGCMLKINRVHYLPDGRSLVDTVGGCRFHVLARGKRDGYNTARVEFLQDDPITEAEIAEIQAEQTELYTMMQTWLFSLPLFHRARIIQRYGSLPDLELNPRASPNGPSWAWWSMAILPLDPPEQLALLALTSYKQRLIRLRQILGRLRPRLL